MRDLQKLIGILKETRAFIAQDDNDFSWSSWVDQADALTEVDSIIAKLESGFISQIGVLFAPTGPIQEVRLGSGWGNEVNELVKRCNREYAIARNRS
jgi:hypothetical protein